MTKASIEAYLTNISSGNAKSQTEKVIAALMWRKFASTYELSQDVGAKTNTIGARLKALLSIGCVYECGDRTHKKTKYSLYMWVENEENWPIFGKVYRKKLAMRRAQSIVNNPGEHTTGMIIRAQLEVEKLKGQVNQLMWGLPEPIDS